MVWTQLSSLVCQLILRQFFYPHNPNIDYTFLSLKCPNIFQFLIPVLHISLIKFLISYHLKYHETFYFLLTPYTRIYMHFKGMLLTNVVDCRVLLSKYYQLTHFWHSTNKSLHIYFLS